MSDLTPEDVQEILRLVDESELDELELETPRFTVRWRRTPAPPEPSNTLSRSPGRRDDGLVEVTAPMVGTFYAAPAPGAEPFVAVGSGVAEETQVCILEVMKLMNAVVAGVRGVVAEVCVENGAAVQFGETLFRIRPA
ncbi:MAG TPA: biotin/lipoyl-containing protein [Gaiellaceae bacterium]|nr:biotin/lipoyl-containing protein [Gaiellaceae bacterium]